MMKYKSYAVIFISLLGILIYSNTFHSSFHFDDYLYIVNYANSKNFQDLSSIWQSYPCRLIAFLTFVLNYQLHHFNVFGYHLFNLLIHISSAVLVWWLTLLIFSTPAMKENRLNSYANLIAILAGLIFVSHPIQTQAVTYVWQRVASLAAFFYLLSLCLYIKSRLLVINSPNSNEWKKYYVISLLTVIAAMFTKEMTITIPLMILLLEFSFFCIDKRINWKQITPFLLTILIIPLVILLLPKTIRSQEMEGVITGFNTFAPLEYLLTEIRVMITYIRLAFLPVGQNLDYDFPISHSIFEVPTFASFIALIVIFFLTIRSFVKYRMISFFIIWFFMVLLPESSFVPLKDVIQEHRLYLPIAGYSIFLSVGIFYVLSKRSIVIAILFLSTIVLCNSILTYERNKIWKDDLTLWSDTVLKSPNKDRPIYNRGLSAQKKGDHKQAVADFTMTIKINPSFAKAFCYRGLSYLRMGQADLAMLDFNKAIELDPTLAEAYKDRGNIYGQRGEYKKAFFDLNKAIELNPNYAEAFNDRAINYFQHNDLSLAINDLTKAIELRPNYIEAYNNRGILYGQIGEPMKAFSDLNKAIGLDPSFSNVYNSRAGIYFLMKEYDKSWADVKRAEELGYKINPEFLDKLMKESRRER